MKKRSVFLDELPRWGNGSHKGKIKWKESVGKSINFVYDGIKDKIKIIEYNYPNLKVKYANGVYRIATYDLIKGKFGRIVGKRTEGHMFKVGEIIEKKSKLKVMEKTRYGKKAVKSYKYRCLTCGNIDEITEYQLTMNTGYGCNVCAGQKVLKNYNDLWTTHPKTASLLLMPEMGYVVSKGQRIKLDFVCPSCNVVKRMFVKTVVEQGVTCFKCSEGVSYPEKFMASVLDQIHASFEKEKVFEWSKKIWHVNQKLCGYKRYDFYIQASNCIIETHGKHHYIKSGRGKTLEEEQENDIIKKRLAENNGVKHYIVVNCKHSDPEWIKNNILNSCLVDIFNLSDIDWQECHRFACNSQIRASCEFWDNGLESTVKIAEKMNLSKTTVIRYLKIGAELGLTTYSPTPKKKVVQLSIDNVYQREWESISEVQNALRASHISDACRGRRSTAGGYKWMYLEDYEKYIAGQEELSEANPHK